MRTARTRAKALTAVGVLTMLFGALLAMAPGVAAQDTGGGADTSGNLDCVDILSEDDFDSVTEAKDDNARTAPSPADEEEFHTFSQDGLTVSYRLDADGVTFEGVTGGDIYAVHVKEAADRQGDSVLKEFDGVTSGFVEYTVGQFSHITFCSGDPKTVCEDDEEQYGDECVPCTPSSSGCVPPCVDDESTPEDECEEPCVDDESTPEDECEEPCVDDESTPEDECEEPCVDNPDTPADECDTTPPPPPGRATLRIVKAVTGEDAPADWSFLFDGGSLSTFELEAADPDIDFGDLAPGTYTVVESDPGDFDLDDIDCDDDATFTVDLDERSLSVTLSEGDVVECQFTNDYPDVLGEVVTRPPPLTPPGVGPSVTPGVTPTANPVAPAPQVGGNTVRVGSLARTGDDSRNLAGVGISLLLFGGVLVAGSTRRLRYLS